MYLSGLLCVLSTAALITTPLHASPNPSHYSMFNRTHTSNVFGAQRQYRVSLPDAYNTSGKDYPVIYFLHGWSGWNPDYYDTTRIDSLVNARDAFIIVMPDGFMSPSDAGPYNVSIYCTHQEQYADYFLELVGHMDSTYRTVADRSGRAILGHSMGGFMAYFLPWKFPDLVAGTINNTGSAEFPVGYPDNQTLISWRYAMANHHGMHLRLNNSTEGELHYLNTEVHQGTLREKGLSYEYVMKPGGHQVDYPGELTVFVDAMDFLQSAMAAPLPRPVRWHHADLYPDFDVWGYSVDSDKNEPGFIELTDVTDNGFGFRTREWHVHPRRVVGITSTVTTAPVYDANTAYTVSDYNVTRDSSAVSQVTSDTDGRISYVLNHEDHQVGIYKSGGPAEIVCIGYHVDDSARFLPGGQPGAVRFRLLNRGGTTAAGVTMGISAYEDDVTMSDSVVAVPDIPAGAAVWSDSVTMAASYTPPDNGRPWQTRCNLAISDDNDSNWTDETDIDVFFNAAPFTHIAIDDGQDVSSDYVQLGTGDGDGIPDPGETIMLYERIWRMRLYYEDTYVDPQDETLYLESLPSRWSEDGLTQSSLIKIPADCPIGHTIRFLASYDIKLSDTMQRIVKWGTVSLTIGQPWSGIKETAPASFPVHTLPNPVDQTTVWQLPAGTRVAVYSPDGASIHTSTGSFSWDGVPAGIYVTIINKSHPMLVVCTGR